MYIATFLTLIAFKRHNFETVPPGLIVIVNNFSKCYSCLNSRSSFPTAFSTYCFWKPRTAKWIWDGSKFSSVFPKQYEFWLFTCFVLRKNFEQRMMQESKQNNLMFAFWFATLTKHVNQQVYALEILKKISICLAFKVHIFWECQKFLRNLHLTFVCM